MRLPFLTGVPRGVAVAALLVVCVAVTACGGGSSSTTASSGGTSESNTGNSGSKSSGGDPVAAAEKVIAPFTGQPSPFPVEEPLTKPMESSTTITYVACPSPVCIENWNYIEKAGKVMGVQTKLVKAGASAQEVANAMDTVVAEQPDAVLVAATEVSLWHAQLEELQSAGTKIVTLGVADSPEFGIEGEVNGVKDQENVGRQMAAKAVAEAGPEANIGFYYSPELGFLRIVQKTFEEELGELCPECSARYIQIPVTQIGNTAPNRIVSDLEANPETDITVVGVSEIALGLPSAEKVAGLEVPRIGFGPPPPNIEYIAHGEELAGLGISAPEVTWSAMDVAARLLNEQPLSSAEAEHTTPVPPVQWLSKEDVTAGQPFIGYPDFEKRFGELWAGK
jgi:ribose transport system substrate-binding protein